MLVKPHDSRAELSVTVLVSTATVAAYSDDLVLMSKSRLYSALWPLHEQEADWKASVVERCGA